MGGSVSPDMEDVKERNQKMTPNTCLRTTPSFTEILKYFGMKWDSGWEGRDGHGLGAETGCVLGAPEVCWCVGGSISMSLCAWMRFFHQTCFYRKKHPRLPLLYWILSNSIEKGHVYIETFFTSMPILQVKPRH